MVSGVADASQAHDLVEDGLRALATVGQLPLQKKRHHLERWMMQCVHGESYMYMYVSCSGASLKGLTPLK